MFWPYVIFMFLPSVIVATEVRFGILVTNAKQQMLLNRDSKRVFGEALEYFNSQRLSFTKKVKILQPPIVSLDGILGPSNIINIMCEKLLTKHVNALLFVSFDEDSKIDEVNAIQYLFQLSSYLHIPVIAWHEMSSERTLLSDDLSVIQMASTIYHQVGAVFSILERYSWHQFSVVTVKTTSGHNVFMNAIRQERNKEAFKTRILSIIEINSLGSDDIRKQMKPLEGSETRVIVLFAHKNAAVGILQIANELGLINKDHIWICMQKVIGDMTAKSMHPPQEYPIGMLGIDVNMTEKNMVKTVANGIKIYGHGLDILFRNNEMAVDSFSPNISCDNDDAMWSMGKEFYKALRKVQVPLGGTNSPKIEFNKDGSVKYAEFDIVNLIQDPKKRSRSWITVGSWNTMNGLHLSDIVWPAGSPVPPRGKPDKFHLTVVTLSEVPYVELKNPDATGKCEARTARCREHVESPGQDGNATGWVEKCCTGLCIDLLIRLGQDIGFTFDIYQVEDKKWGRRNADGTWNGLIADLLKRKAHVAMTSLTVTKERQAVISFSNVFMETGITIVVAKREGVISPTAFLEPFDYVTWIILVVVCIQVVSIFIFLFEWLSPSGFNMQRIPDEENRFSFCRVYWLVFTIFFGATCPVRVPRSFTARCLTAVWACCAFIFIAIYTANLATFMITREEAYVLEGIKDKKFWDPYAANPHKPFRFGTIGSGSTSETIKNSYRELYDYMQKYNKDNVSQGIEAVKSGALDAFLYDATVLTYRVGSDEDCRILTVGSWFATTGYAMAFSQGSPFVTLFDEHLLRYQQNGYLEQVQRFWLTGACEVKTLNHEKSSHALDIKNFTSAFLFLAVGILSGVLCLAAEWIYFHCIQYGVCGAMFESPVCRYLSCNISRAVLAVQARRPRPPQHLTPQETMAQDELEADLKRIYAELIIAKMQVNKLENIHKRLRQSPLRRQNSVGYKFKAVANDSVRQRHRRSVEVDANGVEQKLHVTEIETVL